MPGGHRKLPNFAPHRAAESNYPGLLSPPWMRQNCYGMAEIPLTREQALQTLIASEAEIRALGVQRLALFGSVARSQARVDSDVDLLVQFIPGEKTYGHFLALSELLEARLGRRVELVTLEALSPFLGPHILAEAEDVLRAA